MNSLKVDQKWISNNLESRDHKSRRGWTQSELIYPSRDFFLQIPNWVKNYTLVLQTACCTLVLGTVPDVPDIDRWNFKRCFPKMFWLVAQKMFRILNKFWFRAHDAFLVGFLFIFEPLQTYHRYNFKDWFWCLFWKL